MLRSPFNVRLNELAVRELVAGVGHGARHLQMGALLVARDRRVERGRRVIRSANQKAG